MDSPRINRRKFLVATSAIAAAACSSPLWAVAGEANSPGRRGLDLNGAWEVSRTGLDEWFPATVPGCIHTDLLAAGRISDPFYRDNEKSLQWIGETNWTYRRSFEVPEEFLKLDCVRLRCDGLDTLATVKINGQKIGETDNMFRIWEFDVKPILRAGGNTIEILFTSPLPLMKERQTARPLYEWIGPHETAGRAWVRKEPCNFGWDWGPVLITCGVWRGIGLESFNHARLAEVSILQDHSVAERVNLRIEILSETAGAVPLSAAVSLSQAGKILQTNTVALAGGVGRTAMEIDKPKLWWPAGMGAQPLYEVSVELREDSGVTIDRMTKRIGLRTLKLLPQDKKNSLRFEVNGVPFFAKGANCIPGDPFANRVSPEKSRRLVADAVSANMNALRFWGGGYYEDNAFFDACDEMGICVWMDFKFACSSYPVFDAQFMDNVEAEARDQLRRLRHHACIAVWCGNNEISLMTGKKWTDHSMARSDYDSLFKELLGSMVAEYAPQANYVTGSPDCGDVHYWGVWHGGKPFEAYRSLAGFMSEFGFQSFPHPRTVASFTAPEDRESILSSVMQWHQRSGTTGNQKLQDMTRRYFNEPKDFESALWASQMLQAHAIKTGAEHWRRAIPKSMGCMFWQYNDTWPGTTWSSVDYFGRWKALQYCARRFYAPMLVSGLEKPRRGEVQIHVTNDHGEARHGTVEWQVTDLGGNEVRRGSLPVELAPRSSAKVTTLKFTNQILKHGASNLLVWLKLFVDGKTESENLVTFVPFKKLELQEPQLKTLATKDGDCFVVTVTAAKPALWCWLDLDDMDARYSDNFFHLAGSESKQIFVTPDKTMSLEDFTKALRARSLVDTYLPDHPIYVP
jgi:beta-mannosidase